MSDLTQTVKRRYGSPWQSRYRSKLESAKARDAELESKHGQRLMRSILPDYSEAIQDWKDTVEKYDRKARYQIDTAELPSRVIAYIAVKSIIDSISKKRPLSQVSIYLGARIEDELRCRFLCETNEGKAEGILLGAKRRKGESKDTSRPWLNATRPKRRRT